MTQSWQTGFLRDDATGALVINGPDVGVVSLADWKDQYPNLGNGSNDDTAAIRAWVAEVIAKRGRGVAPAPSSSYSLTDEVYLGPAAGQTTATFTLEFEGDKTHTVQWLGGSGTDTARLAMFRCVGWKNAALKNCNPRIPTQTYVTAFEIDNPSTTYAGSNVSAGVVAGTSIQVASTVGLQAGQPVTWDIGGVAETLTVQSIVDATHLTFTANTAQAHTTGSQIASRATSFSESDFERCRVSLPGNQAGVVGWRIGHTDLANTDFSFINWRNAGFTAAARSGNSGSTGQSGFVNEGPNSLHLCWYGGNIYFADTGITNQSTNGAANADGGGALFVYGLGTSGNALDFQFKTFGVYGVYGGRFENGQRLLDAGVQGSTAPLSVKLAGTEVEGYSPGDSILVSCVGSVALSVEGGYWGSTGAAALWGSSMIQLSSSSGSSRGALAIRDLKVAATDPWYSFGSGVSGQAGDYSAQVINCTLLDTTNRASGKAKNVTWVSTQTSTDGIWLHNGAPGNNSGAATWLHVSSSTPGSGPRTRVGFDASYATPVSGGLGGAAAITDAGTARDVYVGSNGRKLIQVRQDGQVQLTGGLHLNRNNPGSFPYTILATDCYIAAGTGTAKTVNLPSCATVGAGYLLIVKDRTGQATTNNLTVAPNGTDTIELGTAGASKALRTNFAAVTLVSDGTSNWEIVNQLGTFS